MHNHDPREQLIETGNKLLNVIYDTAEWQRRNPKLMSMMDRKHRGEEIPEDEMMQLVQDEDVIKAIFENLQLEARYQDRRTEYVILRRTIEALDAPRASVPSTDA